MLCGVVGSGKSTWIEKQGFDWITPDSTDKQRQTETNRAVLVSSDAHIDKHAEHRGSTYNGVFKDYIGTATFLMNKDLEFAIKHGYDIVWDQTNLDSKTRASKLAKIPPEYEKTAVAFNVPDEVELNRRLGIRPGKTIPPDVVRQMQDRYQVPTKDEGFNEIIQVKNVT